FDASTTCIAAEAAAADERAIAPTGAPQAQSSKSGARFCLPLPAWPGHEPVGYTQYLGLRDHCESELLIEANVLGFVGFQIGERATAVQPRAEIRQHGTANPLALKLGVGRDRSQVPVRCGQVAARPRPDPCRYSHRRPEWVAKCHRRDHTEFFQPSGLAQA